MTIPEAMETEKAPLSRRGCLALLICLSLTLAGLLLLGPRRPVEEVRVVVSAIPGDFTARQLIAEMPTGERRELSPTPRSTKDTFGDGPIVEPFMFREDPLDLYVRWDGVGRLGLVGIDADQRTRIAWFSASECALDRSTWPYSTPEVRIRFGYDRDSDWVSPDLATVLGSPHVAPEQLLDGQRRWLLSLLATAKAALGRHDGREAAKTLKSAQDCCVWIAKYSASLNTEQRDSLKTAAARCDAARDFAEQEHWERLDANLKEVDASLRWLFER